MAIFEQFNRVNTIKEGMDLTNMEFRKLREFVGQDVYVDGFFFTHGKYGEQLVVVGNGYKINMPNKAIQDFKKMQSDPATLDAIMKGHLKITSIALRSTPKGDTVNYLYKDC